MTSPRDEPQVTQVDHLLFISEFDVSQLNLSAHECCDVMQEIFLAYSRESAFALPAVHLDISPGRGFRSLCAAWPGRNIAGNKWFGVRPTMPGQRGVGVQALYLLNDYGTGVPLAVISANQLTGIRTASMSAFVLRAILTDPPPTVGFIV